jgi:hypothetical protein
MNAAESTFLQKVLTEENFRKNPIAAPWDADIQREIPLKLCRQTQLHLPPVPVLVRPTSKREWLYWPTRARPADIFPARKLVLMVDLSPEPLVLIADFSPELYSRLTYRQNHWSSRLISC